MLKTIKKLRRYSKMHCGVNHIVALGGGEFDNVVEYKKGVLIFNIERVRAFLKTDVKRSIIGGVCERVGVST